MSAGSAQQGYTLLGMMILVAVMGAGVAAYGEASSHAAQREKEAELLFRGRQYQLAIESYYRRGQSYPPSLEHLVRDPRFPGMVRHLRRLYADPMTGKAWGLLPAPGGGIMGVYSLSEEVPIKRHGFAAVNRHFAAAARYQDWQFFHAPGVPAAAR